MSKYFGSILIFIGIILAILFLLIGNYIFVPGTLDPNMIYLFSGFMGGTVGSIFSLAGYLIIYQSFVAQRKQGVELIYFNLLDNFNRLRYNSLVYKTDDKVFYGIETLIEINNRLDIKFDDLNNYSSEILTSQIKPYLNEISCYIGAIECLCNHLSSNKKDLKEYFDVYFDQLTVSLSKYERDIIYFYYYSKSINKNLILDKIKSTPNTLYK